jgi:hypothetical protein
MFGSSTVTRAVCPLTLRAIDLVTDWLSYGDRHLAARRMLSNARSFVFVGLDWVGAIRGCGIAIDKLPQYSTNGSTWRTSRR